MLEPFEFTRGALAYRFCRRASGWFAEVQGRLYRIPLTPTFDERISRSALEYLIVGSVAAAGGPAPPDAGELGTAR